jgi:hypothetical protein
MFSRITVCVSGSRAERELSVETRHCLGVDKTQFIGANPFCPLHTLLGGVFISGCSELKQQFFSFWSK